MVSGRARPDTGNWVQIRLAYLHCADWWSTGSEVSCIFSFVIVFFELIYTGIIEINYGADLHCVRQLYKLHVICLSAILSCFVVKTSIFHLPYSYLIFRGASSRAS